MHPITSLSTTEGRTVLRNLYKKLRLEEQQSGVKAIYATLIVAINSDKLSVYDSSADDISHKLGLRYGFRVWMEEIINRYYYSTINSFVYFGAAILLVIVGLTRFRSDVEIGWVIAGIGFEAFLLLMVFVTMYFTPAAEDESSIQKESSKELQEELLDEIGEIGRDMAAVSVQFEKITKQLETHNYNSGHLISEVREIAGSFRDLSAPNPELLKRMEETGTALKEFAENIESFNKTVQVLSSKVIEEKVREELSKILEKRINDS